jgi:hypothetical protein
MKKNKKKAIIRFSILSVSLGVIFGLLRFIISKFTGFERVENNVVPGSSTIWNSDFMSYKEGLKYISHYIYETIASIIFFFIVFFHFFIDDDIKRLDQKDKKNQLEEDNNKNESKLEN